VQDELERRGFRIARRWQECLLESCAPKERVAVEQYWDELALEWMCSAGKVTSTARRFRGETGYRSKFLDDLARCAPPVDPEFRRPNLLPCVYEFDRRVYFDKNFGISLTERLERHKQSEIDHLQISGEGWTGMKRDASAIFRNIAERSGFRLNGPRLSKETSSGLVFQCWVDVGGRAECAASLHLRFFISHKANAETTFEAGFNEIIPGFAFYGFFMTPRSAVLGMVAHVQLFDLLFESLS
jgi:hypothetical protein